MRNCDSEGESAELEPSFFPMGYTWFGELGTEIPCQIGRQIRFAAISN